MLFGCKRSCSSARRAFNSKVPQGVSTHIKFERDRLNIFRVRVFTSSGSTGGGRGGDAKTIISSNTSFGDIIINQTYIMHKNPIYKTTVYISHAQSHKLMQVTTAKQYNQQTSYMPETAGYMPKTAGYRPQTAGHTPQTAGYRPQTAGYRPQTAGCRPQTAGNCTRHSSQ